MVNCFGERPFISIVQITRIIILFLSLIGSIVEIFNINLCGCRFVVITPFFSSLFGRQSPNDNIQIEEHLRAYSNMITKYQCTMQKVFHFYFNIPISVIFVVFLTYHLCSLLTQKNYNISEKSSMILESLYLAVFVVMVIISLHISISWNHYVVTEYPKFMNETCEQGYEIVNLILWFIISMWLVQCLVTICILGISVQEYKKQKYMSLPVAHSKDIVVDISELNFQVK